MRYELQKPWRRTDALAVVDCGVVERGTEEVVMEEGAGPVDDMAVVAVAAVVVTMAWQG